MIHRKKSTKFTTQKQHIGTITSDHIKSKIELPILSFTQAWGVMGGMPECRCRVVSLCCRALSVLSSSLENQSVIIQKNQPSFCLPQCSDIWIMPTPSSRKTNIFGNLHKKILFFYRLVLNKKCKWWEINIRWVTIVNSIFCLFPANIHYRRSCCTYAVL